MDFEPFSPSASQQRVLDAVAAPAHGPLLVYGGPGTGKTTLAVELALRELRAGYDSRRLLVLSPTRATSARLRDEIEQRFSEENPGASMSETPARSFASYAFWLLGEARRRRILSFASRAPRLLSGAEQDGMIQEILEALASDPEVGWPEELGDAADTDGFRKEIRELLDRATEYGVSPERLRELAEECARPEWHTAAEIYSRYLDRLELDSHAEAYDPSGLINAACGILEENEGFLAEERARISLLVVDDLQEATPTVYRLLRLVGAGRDVVAFASPDVVTQGFRGARPDKLGNWTAPVRSRVSEGGFLDPEQDTTVSLPGTDGSDTEGSDTDGPGTEGSGPGERRIVRRAGSGSMVPDQHGGLPGAPPQTLALTESHRLSEGVSRVYSRTVQRIAPGRSAAAREPWTPLVHGREGGSAEPFSDATAVEAFVAPADYVAEQHVLQEVLQRHDRAEVPFREIAVIVRSGHAAQRMVRVLQAQGVPVRQSMSDVILHEEQAVWPLLRILDLASQHGEGPLQLELGDVLDLLTGRYGDADGMTLRRLRQTLLRAERALAAQEGRPAGTSDEVLVLAAQDPEHPLLRFALDELKDQGGRVVHGLRRIARMLTRASAVMREDPRGAGAEQVLWAAWEAAGVAERWAELTRRADVEGRRANRDLDAVMALFQAAERFADQNPGAGPVRFVEHMSRLELPMDTLAETSAADDAVEVLTPATAAGREFDTVVLCGLQEGVWPNLRPRGELLGSTHLVDVVEHRASPEGSTALVRRLQVLQDEYRLFATAVSRARTRLLAVAVEGNEESPSMFLDLVVPAAERAARTTPPPRPITGPRLIAELRRTLEESLHRERRIGAGLEDEAGGTGPPSADAEQAGGRFAAREEAPRRSAARALALLAEHGITGADPEDWWGLPPVSTQVPILGPEEEIRVSPSNVQTAVESPLQWFTGAAGGVEPTDFSRMLGTLIHEIAEDHPEQTDPEVLTAVLAQRWSSLGLDDGWQAEAQREAAEDMLRQLAGYHRAVQEKRRVLGLEVTARAELEIPVRGESRRVRVSGMIDRVESTPDGRLCLVDLKTGRSAPSAEDTGRHAQLGVYQLLVHLGAVGESLAEAGLELDGELEVDSAALLYVAVNKNHTIREQPAVPAEAEQAWPRRQVRLAAEVMSSAEFAARHAPNQRSCRIGPLCPLCAETKQVTQP